MTNNVGQYLAVSDTPFDQLEVGDKLISAKGRRGVIVSINRETKGIRCRFFWDSGVPMIHEPVGYHQQLKFVLYVGKEKKKG